MKLSFSLSSKSQSTLKKAPTANALVSAAAAEGEQASGREYVTEFDSSKALTDPAGNKKDRVIAPISNEWRPAKRMKNLDLPIQSGSSDQHPTLEFEVDSSSSIDPSSNSMSYGLNLRSNSSNKSGTDDVAELSPPSAAVNADPELYKLKHDLERLPDDNGPDGFTDMPVEDFGRALLAGYGWREGMGIGRNTKEDVKVVEYKKRTAKEGLGFTGELPKLPPKFEPRNVNGRVNDGNKKVGDRDAERGAGEVKREEKRLYVGKDVRIVGGREMGMKGRVMEVKHGGEFIVLRLSKSGEDVRVQASDLADIGSLEEERCLRKLKELRIREKSEVSERESGKERDRKKASKSGKRDTKDEGMKHRREDHRGERRETKGSDKVSWLTSHIRVRIISKELKGGRLYLKKGEVVDVVGPTTCDISMDESRELVQGVDQELLETALPKRGGPVLVLYGRHKGVYGSLVERDAEKETGVIRDSDSHELVNVRLEQIAEYIGDPSYIGY